ncbi:hypothetical protein [Roseovarius aestuariivivens]|uniref:hypothetical protein n=1 Tax=Roseovarius aestuariivivens TaxID=1888910 RepID=UPI0010804851|nr:hypothetical protein [Roseovarius aestuariivivens]
MSDTDSFIDEVTEEVRRDRLYATFRRYGWIAVLAILLLVGGAAWNEWRKAQTRAEAQALGDSILAALEAEDRAARAAALGEIDAARPGAETVLALLAAGEQSGVDPADAAARLLALADDPATPAVYRDIALLKAVAMTDSGLSPEDRRARLDGMAPGGGLVRLLAEEQLALLEVETGQPQAALERLQQIRQSAEASPGLRRRASQVIVALGGDLEAVPGADTPGMEETGAEAGN